MHIPPRARLRAAATLTSLAAAAGLLCTTVMPAGAVTATASATVTSGVVNVSAPGIPGLLQFCSNVLWSYNGAANTYANVYLGGTFFVGPITFNMTVSGCENANGGGGSVSSGSISGTSLVGGGTITCSFSGGSYTRQLEVFQMSVPTSCTTDGVTGNTFTMDLTGAWVPVSTTGQGVIAYITNAVFAGVVASAS